MKLVFLRHGKAEERGAGQTDAERRLTPDGIEEMRSEAAGMRALRFRFDRVLSSPLPRALLTAQIVANALANEQVTVEQENEKYASKKQGRTQEVEICDALSAGRFTLGELQSMLAAISSNAVVLLVGHEPDLSSVVQRLTGAQLEMKKGSAACVEVHTIEPQAGILRWLLTPRHLIAAGLSETVI